MLTMLASKVDMNTPKDVTESTNHLLRSPDDDKNSTPLGF